MNSRDPEIVPRTPREGQEQGQEFIQQPAKLIRIGSMVKELLGEARQSPLDEAGRKRLKEIHERAIAALRETLSEELQQELETLSLPLDSTPSQSEIRIAQAQLVGWLEGLFQGIQAALFSQQMAARAQMEQMRQRGLPPGPGEDDGRRTPGHYL
ncbi:MAG: DUF2587 domain-containing protein [Candidatus Rokubacteria bacterium]|nr:DUF2587 domain-containing protein [Candidatus Rokubacteria bacterium]